MLKVRNLNKSYRASADRAHRRVVLQNVSFEVAAGESVAVMGESGVGKSTLLNLIAGLEAPDGGSVLIDRVEITALVEPEVTRFRRSHIGFVFQAFHLLPYLSVAGNVEMPLLLNGTDARVKGADTRVVEVLQAVGLADRADSPVAELSGGQSQRVAVARALVHRPTLVLADEPTGNLDSESSLQVLHLLREQARQLRTALVVVTHSLAAARLMDTALQLTADGLHPL